MPFLLVFGGAVGYSDMYDLAPQPGYPYCRLPGQTGTQEGCVTESASTSQLAVCGLARSPDPDMPGSEHGHPPITGLASLVRNSNVIQLELVSDVRFRQPAYSAARVGDYREGID